MTHRALGRLGEERGELRTAREAYEAAREVIERTKSALRHPGLRASFERAPLVRDVYGRAASDGAASDR